ncbi:hypothetical protein IEQ34_020929 [Dendrobium chrysotoxum]|uniref:Uncharacterized protein n=1 Tax=Dendrobium chrysotoxum TaxID=161865 RepID=A0AAV7G236_DENCH|nr:hypothetical protein IEQ34_020929 [Dendrobium chrysotoxum]
MYILSSLSLKHCQDHYAFLADWNLPDKEFCYLKTVIVTVVVYQGFGHQLSCHQFRRIMHGYVLLKHRLLLVRDLYGINIVLKL